MNMNKFAKEITLAEGLKKSVSIGQVKEILRIVLKRLAKTDMSELIRLLKRYE